MKKLVFLFIVLALATVASASTTAAILPQQFCVKIANCQVVLDNGNRLWVQNDPNLANHFVEIQDSTGGTVIEQCTNITTYTGTPQPDGTITLHVVCDSITVDENYKPYQTRSGTRYQINGGTVTY